MQEPAKMIIYNLFPLLVGTFSDWEKHLKRASEMGFNWVFVNSIQRPGKSGSLYAISDYFDFNPLFVQEKSKKKPENQVKEAITSAEKTGLRVMVDLVINHCSVDSDLLQSHPEWFAWEDKKHVVHPTADQNGKTVVWEDLARFDHQNTEDKEGLYQFFIDVIKFLADLGFKGFRCDAAYQIPPQWWERLIGETKKHYPEILFFAETLGCPSEQAKETARAGFDYTFNSSKWWDFKGSWLMKQYTLMREITPSIAFPESHDTTRLYKEFNGNVEGMKQRYLFSALFSAGVMMTIGFEFGFRQKPHVVKTRPQDWEGTTIDLRPFITKVNTIKSEHIVFREDAPTEILHYGNPNILFMWKASTRSSEEALLIFNKDIHNKQHFSVDNLQEFLHSRYPLVDISPEYPLDYVPAPFSYDLRPGQGIILVTSKG